MLLGLGTRQDYDTLRVTDEIRSALERCRQLRLDHVVLSPLGIAADDVPRHAAAIVAGLTDAWPAADTARCLELCVPRAEVEPLVHDVLNVFMCTGFTRDTGQYFMKASPVRPGDFLEFFAEIDLLGALSACPGGDCSAEHSSDAAACHPLLIEVFAPPEGALEGWAPPPVNGYDRSHGR